MMMTRRTALKWLHWLSAALILWFLLIEPGESRTDPGGALSVHAGMGLLLAVVTVIWLGLFVTRGLTGRPGPKLPGWAKRLHPLSHKALHWAVPLMLLSGALTGVAAPFAIAAFGTVPIAPGIGTKGLHDLLGEVHEIVFNGLLVLIVGHALFHIGRHILLRDNALRIMVPKRLHRWL